MARNEKVVQATPEDVFAVLIDPAEFPRWVVGAHAIEGVDPRWPSVGAAFQHRSAGGGVSDKTEILEIDEPKHLVLRAYLRPLGIARVEIDIESDGDGARIILRENADDGTKLAKVQPLVSLVMFVRNLEAMRRLRKRIEARAGRES